MELNLKLKYKGKRTIIHTMGTLWVSRYKGRDERDDPFSLRPIDITINKVMIYAASIQYLQ